jgi:hypothetical protein
MVKATVRNIVLGLMKINKPLLLQYYQSYPFVAFYSNLTCHMIDSISQID